MEKTVKDVYEKPEIKDFGTLQQLTAACVTPGAGDFHGVGFSTHSATSTGHCTSSK